MFRLIAFLAAFEALVTTAIAAGPEVDARQLPRVPATPPEKALSTFKVKPGFRLELVAAEPLVIDPIALSFDEDGRCYVVEMRDYSERRPERLGRIRLLEDTNGDGRFDKSIVFAGDLPWPTAVICWDGGVFVGATPDIIYFKDTNGDGVADIREPIFTGFASDYAPFATNKLNVQALMNSFNWSLDNRIHGATSFNGGKVKRIDSPFVRDWLKQAENTRNPKPETQNDPLDLRGRDFSFGPRTLEMRAESGGGQYGMSFDSRGRKFVCSNSSHIQTLMYEERYAARNPYSSMPRALVEIAVDGGAAPVYRISPDEPWRVIRTKWRVNGLVPGPIEGGGRPSGYFTGATGITIYRGDAYGPQFVGDAFVGDAGGNLVHRKEILPTGGSLRAVRPKGEETVEFLASTDNWFRPVQMANAPDGCLYICDMYREVIEHPWSLPESLKKHLDLNSGNDRGRLYRVVPEKFKQPKLPHLSKASTEKLVATLTLANGWHRDTAARLLYQRQNTSIVPALTKVLRDSPAPSVRVHALYALSGLDMFNEDRAVAALSDASAEVRFHAVRLSEHLLGRPRSSTRVEEALLRLVNDPDDDVRRQLAFTIGFLLRDWRVRAAVALAKNRHFFEISNELGTSLGDESGEIFQKLASEDELLGGYSGCYGLLAFRVGAYNRPEDVSAAINALATASQARATRGSEYESLVMMRIMTSLAAGLERSGSSLTKADGKNRLKPIFTTARERALNQEIPEGGGRLSSGLDPRDVAITTLGYARPEEATPTLLLMVERYPMNAAGALSALSRWPDPQLASQLLALWPRLGPAVRSQVVALLLKRTDQARTLLGALGSGQVQRGDFSAAQIEFLRTHRDQAIRTDAARLLAPERNSTRQEIVNSFQAALGLPGNAGKGRTIFEARCATCHQIRGEGHALGPDLATVRNAGKEKLLTNILDPNREVNPTYLAYAVETKGGESLSGLIVNEGANSVTVRMAGGSETVVNRANIASMQSQGRSLMPEGLEEGLTSQDMADLLEFILAP